MSKAASLHWKLILFLKSDINLKREWLLTIDFLTLTLTDLDTTNTECKYTDRGDRSGLTLYNGVSSG